MPTSFPHAGVQLVGKIKAKCQRSLGVEKGLKKSSYSSIIVTPMPCRAFGLGLGLGLGLSLGLCFFF